MTITEPLRRINMITAVSFMLGLLLLLLLLGGVGACQLSRGLAGH